MKNRKYIRYLVVAGVFMIKNLFGTDALASAADFTGKKIVDVSISDKNALVTSNISNVVKLKSGDTFNADLIQQDIKAIYGLGSFYDVQADFIEVPEGIKVIYSVIEKMEIKDIVFKGNTKVSTEKLESLSAAMKGILIDNKKISDEAQIIEKYYHDQGYIVAKVNDIRMDQEGVLTVFINEGMTEDIVIKGNEKTKNHVITRELKLKIGEPFNSKDAKRSIERLNNLGFFEDVNMKLNPGREPNAVVAEVDVKEQKTGTFTIGGGYSKSDGLTSIIGLGDTNFKGTGNNLNVSFQHGYSSIAGTGWNVNFTNPYIDKKETSLSVSLFNSVSEVSDYGYNGDNTTLRSTYYRRSRGFNITLGRPEGEYVKNYVTLTKRTDLYVEHDSGPVDYSATVGDSDYNSAYNAKYLAKNFGEVHSVTLARVYDTRDNIFNPTEGKRVSLTTEIAGQGLGGQFDFNKYIIDGRKYFKVGSKQVLAFHVSVGAVDGDVPDASKFSVGGIDTLRGYEDNEFKGNKMFTATVEYRYPIANKVEGVLFTDAGNAWDGTYKLNDLKYSVGMGLRVSTPIGPIRLDYGYGKEGGRTHFSFGTQF
ncbi:outer membrane protein assembly factor [Pelosinus sp. UFO1]|uniref:BamA/OMP85 family outer membrane protein n=1 Tax=Pelosinus sp. UFO1 TaxID=484770 RepID=UPI0004D16ADF|nr:BamA/TamA family outer membrane protein [Pelosinus sp. UFO1]AIF50696.1 surface antigen (D15) [Pelosinus sp. UFO1]